MTNNQRFCAELATLFMMGALIWSRAEPQQANKLNAQGTLIVQRLEIVDPINGNRTILDGKQVQILDHNGHERVTLGLSGGDNNSTLMLEDNQNVPRVTLTSSYRFAVPSDVRRGAALVLKGEDGEAILSMPHDKESREGTGLRIRGWRDRP